MALKSNETVVAHPAWARPLAWVFCPLLGAGTGWLLQSVAGWVSALPWAPYKGAFELVASLPEPQATIGALVVGGLAGMALAYLMGRDFMIVTVSDDRVTMTRGGSIGAVERSSVGAVFLEGEKLTLLGGASEELAREQCDLNADRLREAFLAHGFPWRPDGDPHKDEYRLWVDGHPDLPEDLNALLEVRARALSKRQGDDAALLRTELVKFGIVIRDEKTHQYWRRTAPVKATHSRM